MPGSPLPLLLCALVAGEGGDGAGAISAGGREWERLEWRASTCSASLQQDAALAIDPLTGNLVVAWSSRRQQAGRSGVFLQRFARDGIAIGAEVCPSLWPRSHQGAPAVAMCGAGGWIAWHSHGQDGDGGAIIARRLDRFGEPVGDEIQVNTDARGDQVDPVLACAADGSAVVAWTSSPGPGAPARVEARLFDPAGLPRGAAFTVAARGEGGARAPAVVAVSGPGSTGTFAVAWVGVDADRRPREVAVAIVDDAGRLGEPTVVSGPGARDPIDPAIASGGEGLVVAWLERSPASGAWRAVARGLGFDGTPHGAPAPVAGTRPGGEQTAVALAAGSGSGLVAIAFTERTGGETDLGIAFLAANLAALGPAVRCTGQSAGEQSIRGAAGTTRLAWAPDGSLLCAWSGEGSFGDETAVHVTMLRPGGAPRHPGAAAARDRGVRPGMQGAAATALAMPGGPQPHEPPTFDPRDLGSTVRERAGASGGEGGGAFGFTGITNTGWVPPDPHAAVGPDHVVAVTNGAVAFLDREGNLLFQDQLEGAGGFFGPVGASGFVFDPETIYDALSGRFLIMAADGAGTGTSAFVLGVSDDSNPLGTWHRYRIDTTPEAGETFDSPNLAVDAGAVYVTGDGFPGGPGNYPVYVLEKASLLAGGPANVVNRLLVPTTAQSAGIPPVSFDDPPALYMVEHQDGSNRTAVRIIALVDPLGTPQIATAPVAVAIYGPPEDPPQAGTAARPNTFDARFWSVAYRDGSLWATHHVDPARVRVRWYQFATNGWPLSARSPSLVQWGEVDPGPGVRTFFSAITTDAHGNAALVFARSAPTEFISMGTAFRHASDPPGTLQPMVIHRVNDGPYTAATRWGDYAAVMSDPVDGLTLWATHEYSIGNAWRTWIAAWTPEFAAADLDFDGAVGVSDLLLLLGAWGDCGKPDDCPGDFDADGAVGIADLLALLAAWG